MEEKKNVFATFDRLESFLVDLRRFAERYKTYSSTGHFFQAEVFRQSILHLCELGAFEFEALRDVYRRPIDRQVTVFEIVVSEEPADELDS